MTEMTETPVEIAETETKDYFKEIVGSSPEYNEYIQNLAEYEKETVGALKQEIEVFNNTFVKKTLAKSIRDIQYKKVNPDFYVEQQIDKIVFTFKQNMDILKYNLKDIVKTDRRPVFKH